MGCFKLTYGEETGVLKVVHNAFKINVKSGSDTDRYGYQGEYAICDPETATTSGTEAIGGWNSFDLRMYDANVGRFLSKDPMGQYYSPYVGMGNNPIGIMDPTGGQGEGIPEGSGGEATPFTQEPVNPDPAYSPSSRTTFDINTQLSPVIDNTDQALDHYFNGNGEPARIGPNTIRELLTSEDFVARNNRIISGQTTSLKGNFSVNMTNKVFHIGRTNVNYSITSTAEYSTVTYNLFVNDGFWDVDFIDEKGLGWTGISWYEPDGLGPNLERLGGTPYSYIPSTVIITFPNPGYK